MTPEWRLLPHDRDAIAQMSRATGLPPLVAHLLLNRGIDNAAAARHFLGAKRDGLHDPETLPGAVDAADRLVRAVRDNRKIVVYGDYDVDGVCGATILWSCLRLAGASNASYYIPHRVEEGYGLNTPAITRLADQGASLIVTVDCGVTAVEEAKVARRLGVELLITDHHTPGFAWPEADGIVHPLFPSAAGPYPHPDMCGAAVAFKLAWQVCKSFGDGKKSSPHLRNYLKRAMNFVALATVADMIPLEGENRIFARHGLKGLLDDDSVGIKALLQVSGLMGKSKLTSGHISFSLAPRINAAGRLSAASRAVELFTTDDAAEALELATMLDDANKERQQTEREIVSEARAMVEASGGLGDRGAIVVGKVGWHPGVIGIVAARLVETYHRPAIVVALNETMGQGSARTVPGFHLFNAIQACSEGLTAFGGHKAAAGLKIRADLFEAFAERFDLHCREALTSDLRSKTLPIDAEVHLPSLTLGVAEAMEDLEPYGIGNSRPVLLTNEVCVIGDPKLMGGDKRHLSCRFGQGATSLRAVGWNMAPRIKELRPGMPCAVVFQVSINEFQGRRSVEMEIKDFRPATASSSSAHAQTA